MRTFISVWLYILRLLNHYHQQIVKTTRLFRCKCGRRALTNINKKKYTRKNGWIKNNLENYETYLLIRYFVFVLFMEFWMWCKICLVWNILDLSILVSFNIQSPSCTHFIFNWNVPLKGFDVINFLVYVFNWSGYYIFESFLRAILRWFWIAK